MAQADGHPISHPISCWGKGSAIDIITIASHFFFRGAIIAARKKVRIVFVGGFLGAGKTTLLWSAARILGARGKRVGLITNDQAPDLVDTDLLARHGLSVGEVAGSCFCCNFRGLIRAAGKLRNETRADVLLAEPVGSCTDLSGAILQPLKERFREEFVPTPLSVLADPERTSLVLGGKRPGMHRGTAYIIRKQFEEADRILINKVDLLRKSERGNLVKKISAAFPDTPVRTISSLTGEGVADWLDDVLAADKAGSRIADVDYDTYAEGEAALGWLNAEIVLSANKCCVPDWRLLCLFLMQRIQEACRRRRAPVGHVKMLMATGDKACVANLTGLKGKVDLRGEVDESKPKARLVVNARVEMPPEDLECLLREGLDMLLMGRVRIDYRRLQRFRPGRPVPTYRYREVIPQ
jgi:Ni2+-binding GTPase involved in maturation of urease and hydrogenase